MRSIAADTNSSALPTARGSALFSTLATSPADIRDSQALRYSVFGEELGAHLHSRDQRLDSDHYDAFCHHLLVRESDTGDVVASTRILPCDRAAAAGGYYSESEFVLGPLRELNGRVMEVGRTCVRADYRTGGAVNLLWAGLARYMAVHHFDYMMGCASIPCTPGSAAIDVLLQNLYAAHMSPQDLRVQPKLPMPALQPAHASLLSTDLPPLLKGYLRLGAWICGEACWDPDFQVADVLILVDVHNVPVRYRRHFLREWQIPA
jgi:putative hemolysin